MVLYSQCFDLLYETFLPLRPNPTLGPTFFCVRSPRRCRAHDADGPPVLSLQLMRGSGDNGGREQLQHAANQPLPMWYGSDIEV